jgi:RimJ/RimL family protein N-acetyltransferase
LISSKRGISQSCRARHKRLLRVKWTSGRYSGRVIGAPLRLLEAVFTDRLELRLPRETDRSRFVELFCDDDFMIFSAGVLDEDAANQRFDEMLVRAEEIPFAKQPVIERSTGTIVGYAGVNTFNFEGKPRLEFGWRLAPAARGRGYATEASNAILDLAKHTYQDEILAMIDPRNTASQNVARSVGFRFWKETVIDGYLDRLYRWEAPRDLQR